MWEMQKSGKNHLFGNNGECNGDLVWAICDCLEETFFAPWSGSQDCPTNKYVYLPQFPDLGKLSLTPLYFTLILLTFLQLFQIDFKIILAGTWQRFVNILFFIFDLDEWICIGVRVSNSAKGRRRRRRRRKVTIHSAAFQYPGSSRGFVKPQTLEFNFCNEILLTFDWRSSGNFYLEIAALAMIHDEPFSGSA